MRPVLSTAPKAGTFKYRFSLNTRGNPDATVVIFIPGGPGQTSMEMGLAFPDSFAVVRTDPRGVGCNKVSLPAESLSSEELAKDILAIVKEIKPKRYILHGISYGTVVATIAAALAEKENVLAPAAVVLEGTMGHVFKKDEYLQGYLQNWQNLKKTLPDSVLKQFKGPRFPLGYTSKEWAAWISAMSIHGLSLNGESLLRENLLLLDPAVAADEKESLIAQVRRSRLLPTPEKIQIYREIICRELVPDIRDVKYDFDFVNGDLVATKDRLCKGIALTRPFDSAKYQIKVPVYYFSGDLDPATPPSQAQYHFQNQKGPRTMVRVLTGGHQALSFNLLDCANELWLAIEKGSVADFKNSLSQCAFKDQVQVSLQKGSLPQASTRMEEAKKILADFERIYQPVAQRLGGTLQVSIKDLNIDEASADTNGKGMVISVTEKYLKNSRLSADGLRFTLCHEMGHLLGGAPRKNVPYEWDGPTASDGLSYLSSEGQSDYYASAVCFREMVKAQDHQSVLATQQTSPRVKNLCEAAWGSDLQGALICQRAALGSYNMLQLAVDFPISLETSSAAVVAETVLNTYPERQCRLDTAVAGALCRSNMNLVFDFNQSLRNDCLPKEASRPACWFNPVDQK